MARWRLTQPHYLNVPGTEWEYIEQSQETGQQARQRFAVPRHLDPRNPRDCNYEGDCVVSDGDGNMPRDYVFTGPPTPDMEPLDEKARAISEAESPKWKHAIESLPVQGDFSQSLLRIFEQQLAAAVTNKPAPALSLKGADPDAVAALTARLEALEKRNAELEGKQAPAATARRV